MNPRTDMVYRDIILDHLRRKLMYVKFDMLDLEFLEPLRAEVDKEIAKLRAPKET